MKLIVRFALVFMGLIVLIVVSTALLTPWMDRWGATEQEVAVERIYQLVL